MKDPIVQEVRDARAAVAADFGFDLHKFFAWAKTHAAAERKAKHWLPTGQDKPLETTVGASKSSVARKGRVRPARVSS
jgi:N6-adenosine-specific RNA methylase IME4